ncbi:MAG: hypothetical protein LUF87_06030 [Alistipes sp.]|nr:hypothetical protein [Alistipes sp.]
MPGRGKGGYACSKDWAHDRVKCGKPRYYDQRVMAGKNSRTSAAIASISLLRNNPAGRR